MLIHHLKDGAPNIWAIVRDYVQKWTWPAAIKFNATKSDLFSEERIRSYTKAQQVKCSASEAMSLLPVLAIFVLTVGKRLAPHAAPCDAFLALVDTVEALQVSMHGVTTPEYLRSCIHTFFTACEDAQWQEHFVPKFHWMVHFPTALEKWGFCPSCWVHERKHKMVKRYADDIQNTKMYSRSVLSEIVSHQLHVVTMPKAFDLSPRLIEPHKANARMHSWAQSALNMDDATDIYSSTSAYLASRAVCSTADVALIKSQDGVNFVAGQIWFLASIDGISFALVSLWGLVSYDPSFGFATWRMADNPSLVELGSLMTPVVWSETNGTARTLIPFEYRGLRAARM